MMTDGAYNTLRQTENNQKVNCDTASELWATHSDPLTPNVAPLDFFHTPFRRNDID